MGQTRLESVRSLDKWLFNEYVRLLRQFNFLSEENIVEFKRNKPSVVFYAGLWPAVGGDNQKISSYNSKVNAIFTSIKQLITDEETTPELKIAEEDIEQVDLLRKVQFARGKFHELTHVLICFLPHNNSLFEKPSNWQDGMPLLFSLAKGEALAEGVADLFLSQLGEPYNNMKITLALREITKDDLKTSIDLVVSGQSKDLISTASHEWGHLLRYRGPNELRSALRKPINDRTNKCEEAVYQKMTKWWEESHKAPQLTKSGR